jgi:glutamate N-acetyltransferase/amino-acid N-acetyltransferase
MAVGLIEPENLIAVAGIRTSAVAAGIKKSGTNDMVLFEIAQGSHCAAVFTKNLFCAAPVQVAKKHLGEAVPRYLLVNSGNANAGTGEQGMQDALQSCRIVADHTNCNVNQVLPFSTGVIGQNLPMDKFTIGIPNALSHLHKDGWLNAGRGIMTTDTLMKGISKQVDIAGTPVTVTGIAKGSGMIRPDMATMLAFIATDAVIEHDLLNQCLTHAVNHSFNAITVDGDTSTNDACVLVATGQANNQSIQAADTNYVAFSEAVSAVCDFLAQAIIRDGEGATKFVTIDVCNASSESDARLVAYTIAHSPLVKTALFASDPNWGRILAAVGRAGIDLDLDTVKIYLDDVCIVSGGGRDASYTEEQGQKVMSQDEITIRVDLNLGGSRARIWTSDLSYDYVKINAEYRT